MIIPGFIISILTFPGVIVHELAHQIFCRLARVAVFDVCYFQLKNPAGYVVHEKPRKLSQHILICIGPFIVNTLVGALIALPSAILVIRFETGQPLDYILVWLGVSIATHAIPSTGDAENLQEAVKGAALGVRMIVSPLAWVIYLFAFGSFFWLDVLYGVGVAMVLPNILVWLLT